MEITRHFDPSTLTDEEKNGLLRLVYDWAHEYPNWLVCSQPYSKGYKDGCYNAHDNLCYMFNAYEIVQGFDPND